MRSWTGWRHSVSALVTLLLATSFAQADSTHNLPVVGGAALTVDTKTVIVSVPSLGVIVYYDVVTEKETKRVEVDFQPLAIAIQGKSIIASTKGSPIVHVLDVETGKETKSIKLPGEPVQAIACHPTKGLIYVTNLNDEVYSIDIASGKAVKTKARGQRIVVDENEGKLVYTGIQKPIRDVLVIEEGAGKAMKVSQATTGLRALLLKCEVDGADLKPVAVNDNACINGGGLGVSPDGSKIAFAGGGGWRSKTDPKANYAIAVFETSDLQTMLGQVDLGPYPLQIAFHPKLNLGVAARSSNSSNVLVVFNAKSFAKKQTIKGAEGAPTVLIFGNQGKMLIHLTCVNSGGATKSQVQFIALQLTNEEMETLKKAYEK